MKKRSFLLVTLLVMGFACSKPKTTAIPSALPSSTNGVDSQNFTPTTAGASANPSYYGNGSYVSSDTSGFNSPTPTTPDGTTATTPTDTSTSSTEPSSTAGAELPDDIGGNLPNIAPYTPPGGAAASTYTYVNEFPLVAQSTSKIGAIVGAYLPSSDKWQAVGIASSGASVYLSSVGTSNFAFSSGTVISINSETGGDIKKVGSTLLGTRNPLSKEVRGISIDAAGKIFGVDGKFLYVIDKPSSVTITDAGLSGAIDTAVTGASLVVATSSGLKKYDPSTLTGKAPVTGTDFGKISPTGGIGTDKDGNVYVVAGSIIKKITPTGETTDVIKDATGAVDVAVDSSNRICVLSKDSVVAYDNTGKKITSFGGEFVDGRAITTSGSNLYVADFGTSYKDSKVVIYAGSPL